MSPIYEFYCPKCTQILEAILPYPPPRDRLCTCGTGAHRVPSVPVVRFNGDGWQTPRPHDDNPWEGTALEDGGKEASHDFMDKRRDRGLIPPRDTKITIDMQKGMPLK